MVIYDLADVHRSNSMTWFYSQWRGFTDEKCELELIFIISLLLVSDYYIVPSILV